MLTVTVRMLMVVNVAIAAGSRSAVLRPEFRTTSGFVLWLWELSVVDKPSTIQSLV